MNYDAILAIFNCIKDKIECLHPEHQIKKEITEDIKKWYEEWQQINSNFSKETIEKNISQLKEGTNGELCIYYITPRESDARVVTDSSEKEKIIETLINQSRDEMVKKTIYNYLDNVLKNIEIPPFNTKKLDEQSVYECKALSNNGEQIKVDYDETKLTTCIKIIAPSKYLKVTILPEIVSTRHDGMIILPKVKKSKSIFNLFKRKSRFELINQEKANFISVTKDEINSKLQANGTIYTEEGVYIFDITNNIFNINYFDQEIITTITTTNLNKKFELTDYIRLLREKKELSNTEFIKNLQTTGILPNAAFSIQCTSKELQILINKAYTSPKDLIEDLYKIN